MRALVTGIAGFIGSNLAARLIGEGWSVRGVDAFTDYYDVARKRTNVAAISSRADVIEADLLAADLDALLDGIDVVFHQAAQPGVRKSWSSDFVTYNDANVNATQRLLEAVRRSSVRRTVFASSSSVYGNAASYPTRESDPKAPHSPYGVTKLAAELLCAAYAANFGTPVVALRYFTVYGPAQRPDMAIHRLIESAMTGAPFPMYGDGSQIRDFTYVGDVVSANVAAATADIPPGTAINVAGGSSILLSDLVDLIAAEVGAAVPIEQYDAQPGDVQRTGGSVDLAHELLGWHPVTSIEAGIAAQVAWHREVRHTD